MSNVSNSVGAKWYSAVEVDFTAQPTQTLAPDGNYTIGGYTFTKINSANELSAMVVTNGVGLVITPNQPGTYGVAARTLPALTLPLTTIPDLTWDTRFRVWLYIASANYGGNYDSVIMSIERALPVVTHFRHLPAYIDGNASINGALAWNATDWTTGVLPLVAYPNTIMIDFLYGLGSGQMYSYHGSVGPTFPFAGMYDSGYLIKRTARNGDTTWITDYGTNGFAPISTCNLLFGACRSGSANPFVVTFGALKVEYVA